MNRFSRNIQILYRFWCVRNDFDKNLDIYDLNLIYAFSKFGNRDLRTLVQFLNACISTSLLFEIQFYLSCWIFFSLRPREFSALGDCTISVTVLSDFKKMTFGHTGNTKAWLQNCQRLHFQNVPNCAVIVLCNPWKSASMSTQAVDSC